MRGSARPPGRSRRSGALSGVVPCGFHQVGLGRGPRCGRFSAAGPGQIPQLAGTLGPERLGRTAVQALLDQFTQALLERCAKGLHCFFQARRTAFAFAKGLQRIAQVVVTSRVGPSAKTLRRRVAGLDPPTGNPQPSRDRGGQDRLLGAENGRTRNAWRSADPRITFIARHQSVGAPAAKQNAITTDACSCLSTPGMYRARLALLRWTKWPSTADLAATERGAQPEGEVLTTAPMRSGRAAVVLAASGPF